MIEEDITTSPSALDGASEQQRDENTVSVVLTADNHLGSTSFGQQPRKREERQQRLRLAFQQATDFAIEKGVDLFIQAGDLFDTVMPHERDRSFVAERLAQLRQAGIRTFALGGVHDTPVETHSYLHNDAQAPQVSYARLGALHYFTPVPNSVELEPALIRVREVLVGICGLGVLAGQEGNPLARLRVQPDIKQAHIPLLILHAPIEGLSTGSSLLDTLAQVSRSSIENQTDFRYILAGYHHRYHHLQIGSCHIIVAGATQHIDFSNADGSQEADGVTESNAPGFVFLGLAADGMRWCEHITVDAPPLQRLIIRAPELWSDAATSPTETMLERLRPLCNEEAMLQLRLVGQITRDEYHQLDLNQIRRYGEEHCFALAIDDSELAILPIDLSFAKDEAVTIEGGSHAPKIERLSPREELLTLLDEWLAGTNDESEQKALRATREELLAAMEEIKTRR
ncbi:MAG: exonuclease SbcCD subunit D [Ktedonobacteraceae bacterium]